jgi:hypothetical protein
MSSPLTNNQLAALGISRGRVKNLAGKLNAASRATSPVSSTSVSPISTPGSVTTTSSTGSMPPLTLTTPPGTPLPGTPPPYQPTTPTSPLPPPPPVTTPFLQAMTGTQKRAYKDPPGNPFAPPPIPIGPAPRRIPPPPPLPPALPSPPPGYMKYTRPQTRNTKTFTPTVKRYGINIKPSTNPFNKSFNPFQTGSLYTRKNINNNNNKNNNLFDNRRLRTQSRRISNSLNRSLELMTKVAEPAEALNVNYSHRNSFATIFYDKYQKEFRAYFNVGSDLFVIKAVNCSKLISKIMNSEKIVENIVSLCGPVPGNRSLEEHIKSCVQKEMNVSLGKQRNISLGKLNKLSNAITAKKKKNANNFAKYVENMKKRKATNNNLTRKIIEQLERSGKNAKGRELAAKYVVPRALAGLPNSRRNRIQKKINNYISKGAPPKSFFSRLFRR